MICLIDLLVLTYSTSSKHLYDISAQRIVLCNPKALLERSSSWELWIAQMNPPKYLAYCNVMCKSKAPLEGGTQTHPGSTIIGQPMTTTNSITRITTKSKNSIQKLSPTPFLSTSCFQSIIVINRYSHIFPVLMGPHYMRVGKM